MRIYLMVLAICSLPALIAGCGNDSGAAAADGGGGGGGDGTIADAAADADSGTTADSADVGASDTGDGAGSDDAAADVVADAVADSAADAAPDTTADVAADAAADIVPDSAADGAADATADGVATDASADCLAWSGGCVDKSCQAVSTALSKLKADLKTTAAKTCASTADCTTVDMSTACQGACPMASHKDVVGAIAAQLKDFSSNVCVAWDAPGKCGYATPGCLAPNPTCEDGVCVYTPTKPVGNCTGPQPANTVCEGSNWVCKPGAFHGWNDTACQEANCDNMKSALQALLPPYVDGSTCQGDEDCTTVDVSTACQGACPLAVSVGVKDEVAKAVGWFDDNVCKPHDFATNCGYSTPKCMAPNPGCKAGKCVYNKSAP